MVFGITMIKVEPGREDSAYLAIQSIKGVKEIHKVFGEYSLFLIMDAYGQMDLDGIVDEIRLAGDVVEVLPVLVGAKSKPTNLTISEREEPAYT